MAKEKQDPAAALAAAETEAARIVEADALAKRTAEVIAEFEAAAAVTRAEIAAAKAADTEETARVAAGTDSGDEELTDFLADTTDTAAEAPQTATHAARVRAGTDLEEIAGVGAAMNPYAVPLAMLHVAGGATVVTAQQIVDGLAVVDEDDEAETTGHLSPPPPSRDLAGAAHPPETLVLLQMAEGVRPHLTREPGGTITLTAEQQALLHATEVGAIAGGTDTPPPHGFHTVPFEAFVTGAAVGAPPHGIFGDAAHDHPPAAAGTAHEVVIDTNPMATHTCPTGVGYAAGAIIVGLLAAGALWGSA